MIKPHSSASRPYFLLAISICLFVVLCIGKAYQKAICSVQRFRASHYTQLDKNFMTEKILGMHFIYHTRICEFDGWRPPKHEPILVIGMWLNNRYDPLPISLGHRLELYRQFFPEKPYKFPCSCGVMYSSYYHTDPIWTSPH